MSKHLARKERQIEAGYKRIGSGSHLYKPFLTTTVYDMTVNEEYDRLVEYYSLSFSRQDAE